MKQIEQIRVAFLWLLMVVGIISHSIFALDTLFFGVNIQLPGTTGTAPMMVTIGHIIFEVMLMLMAFLTLFIDSKAFTWVNRIVACVMAILNAYHLIETLSEKGVDVAQILLLTLILVINIILIIRLWRVKKAVDNSLD